MHILILDSTKTEYNGETLRQNPLGGMETVTICLAEALAKIGHQVTVLNNASDEYAKTVNNVQWSNQPLFAPHHQGYTADAVIVNNDAKLFRNLSAYITPDTTCALWMHNRMKLEKTIRKGHMLALLKYRPIGVFLGNKHKQGCHILHPFRKRVILPHGLEAEYLNMLPPCTAPYPPRAIYCSQAYRGLEEVLHVWTDYISKASQNAELHAYVGQEAQGSMSETALKTHNIYIHDKCPKAELRSHLQASRVMIYPGYKDETFCCAATEAQAMGVPVVSYGIGALSERIENGKNGFLVEEGNKEALAHAALSLLNDEALYLKMAHTSIKSVQNLEWADIAKEWEENVLNGKA